MSRFYRIPYSILAAIIILLPFAAACNLLSTPEPIPTVDVPALQTGVAATIYARLTSEVTATFTPTVTLPPIATTTFTPVPTFTSIPTLTPATPLPTVTTQLTGDAAKFTGTAPPSGFQVQPNVSFNLEFDFLNVGTTTWVPGYFLVWVGGEEFTSVHMIQLDRNVLPGEKGVFILGAFGSEDMSAHTTCWALYTPQGTAVPGGYGCFTYQPV